MTPPPDRPKIYHIVHFDRLTSIIASSGLLCDSKMKGRSGTGTVIGMDNIKQARLHRRVDCHPETHVGDYVPFNFCSRSVMLFVISCQNNPGLAYTDGQGPIVHLMADLYSVIEWAEANGRLWTFSDKNARDRTAEFYSSTNDLDQIDWEAIVARKWSGARVPMDRRDIKQAEFLIHRDFPWTLVSKIGVQSMATRNQVNTVLSHAGHKPRVDIELGWYY